MPQPFDYTLKVPAPGEAFMSGLQIGQQQQQVEAHRARAQAELDKQTRLAAFGAEVTNWVKNPTPDGYKQLMAKYPEYQQEINAVMADPQVQQVQQKLGGRVRKIDRVHE